MESNAINHHSCTIPHCICPARASNRESISHFYKSRSSYGTALLYCISDHPHLDVSSITQARPLSQSAPDQDMYYCMYALSNIRIHPAFHPGNRDTAYNENTRHPHRSSSPHPPCVRYQTTDLHSSCSSPPLSSVRVCTVLYILYSSIPGSIPGARPVPRAWHNLNLIRSSPGPALLREQDRGKVKCTPRYRSGVVC